MAFQMGVRTPVETATDNPTRTVASVRNIFAKGGGNLGATGSVSFLFKKMGVFRLDPAAVKDQDELELDLIDYGLDEMGESTGEKGEPQLVIRGAFAEIYIQACAPRNRNLCIGDHIHYASTQSDAIFIDSDLQIQAISCPFLSQGNS